MSKGDTEEQGEWFRSSEDSPSDINLKCISISNSQDWMRGKALGEVGEDEEAPQRRRRRKSQYEQWKTKRVKNKWRKPLEKVKMIS